MLSQTVALLDKHKGQDSDPYLIIAAGRKADGKGFFAFSGRPMDEVAFFLQHAKAIARNYKKEGFTKFLTKSVLMGAIDTVLDENFEK